MRRPFPVPVDTYSAYVVDVSSVSWAARAAIALKIELPRFPGTEFNDVPAETDEGVELAFGYPPYWITAVRSLFPLPWPRSTNP